MNIRFYIFLRMQLLILALALSACTSSNSSVAPGAVSIFPADPIDIRSVLTALPTDIASITTNVGDGYTGISPMGRFSPSSDHIKPVDHQYVQFQNCGSGAGTCSANVYAMGNGHVSIIFRSANPFNTPPIPADYSIAVGVSKSISYNYDHANALSPALQAYLTTNSAKWYCILDGEIDTPDSSPRCPRGPWAMFLGQLGNPAPFQVMAGELIATATNYHGNGSSWDINAQDIRTIEHAGFLVSTSDKHFPNIPVLWSFYSGKSLAAVDFSYYPWLGRSFHSQCVFDYMKLSVYQDLVNNSKVNVSNPCGHMNWDVAGSVQGVWFTTAVEAQIPSMANTGNMDTGALSIVGDASTPTTKALIGWGITQDLNDTSFAILDPYTWGLGLSQTPSQLTAPFTVPFSGSSVTNPNPALATTLGLTYCYDLPFFNGTTTVYNYLLVNLVSTSALSVKYGYRLSSSSSTSFISGCGSLTPPYPVPPGAGWKSYVR